MTVGVLALQGGYTAHCRVLTALGVSCRELRTGADLDAVDGLVLPGGESSAMIRLFEAEELGRRIAAKLAGGMPALATCAGLILLAATVTPPQASLHLLDVDVVRNAYGRQVASSVEHITLDARLGAPRTVSALFIRAPRIVRLAPEVEVLGWRADDPVLIRQHHIVAATYHPELGDDLRVHRLFSSLVEDANG